MAVALISLVTWSVIACGPAKAPHVDWKTMVEAWGPEDPLPPLPLVNQEGEAFDLGALKDSWVLVSFVFTQCTVPTACPETMKRMQAIRAAAKAPGAPASAATLKLLTLTLDPAHDTPPVLKTWGKNYGVEAPDWILATGDEELLSSHLPSMFNVLAAPHETLGISHSVKAALLAPGLRSAREWKDNQILPAEVFAAMANAPRDPP